MPFVKVYVHLVWSTKKRIPFLNSPELRKKVWKHIWENARLKGIFLDMVNGYEDHCHCLISLHPDQTVSKVIQLIKGESSYWINQEKLTRVKFEWQNDYYAISVSESVLPRVRNYIRNQEAHHKKRNFEVELDELIWIYGFEAGNSIPDKDSFSK